MGLHPPRRDVFPALDLDERLLAKMVAGAGCKVRCHTDSQSAGAERAGHSYFQLARNLRLCRLDHVAGNTMVLDHVRRNHFDWADPGRVCLFDNHARRVPKPGAVRDYSQPHALSSFGQSPADFRAVLDLHFIRPIVDRIFRRSTAGS